MESQQNSTKNIFDAMKYSKIEDKTEDILLNLKIISIIQKRDNLYKNE
jgi:hypothetical protein